MNNKKRIGFVGPYSTANFGDYAILVNNIYDLGCNDIVIFTYNPRFPRVSLEEYCLGIKIKYVEVKLTNDSQLHTNKSGERYFLTPLDALTRLENRNEVYEAIESIDILIISGGGWLNHFWAERLDKLFKIMIPVYVASQKQKKIVFTANGYGPFDETRELYRYFFAYIKDAKIAVRDKYCSLSHLLEVGIDGRSVYYLPDDLYLINPQLLQKELHQQTKQRDYIVIEMFYPLEKLKEYEQQLISFSKKIYQRYGLSIVLLPFDLVQYGSDQAKYLDEEIA